MIADHSRPLSFSNRRWLAPIGALVALVALGVAIPLDTGHSAGAVASPIVAQGSVEQIYATGLDPADQVALVDDDGTTVETQSVGPLGGVVFRDVDPGTGYVLRDVGSGVTSAPVTVHDDTATPWNPEIYDQPIASDGYQYLSTRDGTQLAIAVRPPLLAGSAPWPTLIEYSGYGYADPDGPQSGLAKVANLMGFAVVDVNMRGTGCSGGAFDYFEMLQNLDAYDVIETIANQPWVANHQVGMFGISYGGISQLFAAQLNPPSLAAIAPLSVIDATASTLYPGGILNTGFAMSWAQGRVDDAQPATADTGQRWAAERIDEGDTVCKANQALHPEAVDLLAKIRDNSYYVPSVADPLDPVSFVHKIRKPVFLACQFQDEQTGGHCPELARHFTGTDDKWFTFTNGTHIDSLTPATMNQLFDFLQLFVAEQPPSVRAPVIRPLAPIVYQTALGLPDGVNLTLPDDPIQHETTYAGALAAFKTLPTVQVRFDNGAGSSPTGDTTAGNPYAGFEAGFDTLPAPGTTDRTWYLGASGQLTSAPSSPTDAATDTYTSDAAALAETNYTGGTGGGGLWGNASQWEWDWQPNPSGTSVSYVSEPLAEDATVLGTGSVTVWVRSSTPDVDLQATISEVRPDGIESFVQNGWLRASKRKLSTDAENIFKRLGTPGDPIPTFREADAQPMPPDGFVEVTIPLYYQGHAYRAGSRIALTISAPNGSQPVWAFDDTEPAGATAQVAIARSPLMNSRLTLPVVPDIDIPTPSPACPSLRNEPCRTFVAPANDSEALPPGSTTTTTIPDTSTTTTVPATSTTTAQGTSTTAPTTTVTQPTTETGSTVASTTAAPEVTTNPSTSGVATSSPPGSTAPVPTASGTSGTAPTTGAGPNVVIGPASTNASGEAATGPTQSGTGSESTSEVLAVTGSNAWFLSAIAVALIALGSVLNLVGARRRRTP